MARTARNQTWPPTTTAAAANHYRATVAISETPLIVPGYYLSKMSEKQREIGRRSSSLTRGLVRSVVVRVQFLFTDFSRWGRHDFTDHDESFQWESRDGLRTPRGRRRSFSCNRLCGYFLIFRRRTEISKQTRAPARTQTYNERRFSRALFRTERAPHARKMNSAPSRTTRRARRSSPILRSDWAVPRDPGRGVEPLLKGRDFDAALITCHLMKVKWL